MGQARTARNTVTSQSGIGSGGGTAVATRPSTPKASTRNVTPTQEQIAKRAHEIWIKRGCKPGMDRQNWFEAEAQLRAELAGK
jgi:hypothetical protein